MVEVERVSDEEVARRSRLGKIVAFLSVAWWIIAIGGIIFVIEMNK